MNGLAAWRGETKAARRCSRVLKKAQVGGVDWSIRSNKAVFLVERSNGSKVDRHSHHTHQCHLVRNTGALVRNEASQHEAGNGRCRKNRSGRLCPIVGRRAGKWRSSPYQSGRSTVTSVWF